MLSRKERRRDADRLSLALFIVILLGAIALGLVTAEKGTRSIMGDPGPATVLGLEIPSPGHYRVQIFGRKYELSATIPAMKRNHNGSGL